MQPAQQSARVNAAEARRMLGVRDKRVWRKVVDANPQLVHRLPGEVRNRYLTRELLKLLPQPCVRPLGEDTHT